jgi:hypothetical protein
MADDGLPARLLAAIAETERIAREAGGDEWHQGEIVVGYDDARDAEITAPNGGVRTAGDETVVYDEGRPTAQQAAHIALQDPASTLRRCEADKRIVQRYQKAEQQYRDVLAVLNQEARPDTMLRTTFELHRTHYEALRDDLVDLAEGYGLKVTT